MLLPPLSPPLSRPLLLSLNHKLSHTGAFGIATKGEFRDHAFPQSGMYAHFTPKGWGATKTGQWDDESGFDRHSIESEGDITVLIEVGHGSGDEAKIRYLSGTPLAYCVYMEL